MTGQIIAHYRILDKLGSGGMGAVFRAEDTRDGTQVAIKLLLKEIGGDPDAIERFRREARAAAMLDHPNICKVLEVGEHEGRPYMVMPLINGQTLKQLLASRALTLSEVLKLALHIVEALDAAHARGIIHRDIKPGNIIITPDVDAIVLDFGLAKRVAPRQGTELASGLTTAWGNTLTTTGAPLGTIEYMSPEQVRGEELDVRTDLFSFGLLLFEMATRRRAFEGTTPGVVLEAILNRTPPVPSSLNPDLPAKLDQILGKLLEKDRELRYQTALDLRSDLRRLQRGDDSSDSSSYARRTIPDHGRRVASSGLGAGLARTSPLTRIALAIGVFMVAAFVVGILILPPGAPALTERDTVVLADFANTTGEPIFDGTLKQALAVELGQSPYVNILPEQRVQEALRLMRRSPDERVTRELAREISLREGGKALIAGSISTLGQNYVMTLEAIDARTGESLASEQAESTAKESVLRDLGQSASRLRAKLGESLSSIERFDAPLDRATTPSLDALRAFSLGDSERAHGREFDSIIFFERALELDPNFALAHARLAAIHTNFGETSQAIEHASRAYELRERVSEREKYYITAHYFTAVTGDLEKLLGTCEVWKQAYPNDPAPRINLAANLNEIGQFDRGLAEAQGAEKIPHAYRTFATLNVAGSYLGAGRFPEARTVLEEMIAQNPDTSSAHALLFQVGCATRDAALKKQQIDWGEAREGQVELRQLHAQALAAGGELSKSREIYRQTIDLTRRFNRRELEAVVLARQALVEALFGNRKEARAAAGESLRKARGKDAKLIAALALARSGDLAGAGKAADELGKQYPTDTLAHAVSLPSIRAAIEIESGRPQRAIEILRAVAPYELGFRAGVGPTFLRGYSYLLMQDGPRAAAEFEKIVTRPGIEADSPLHSFAYLALARAYVLTGDQAKSQAASSEFFSLWKSADPDLLIMKRAKSEFARM